MHKSANGIKQIWADLCSGLACVCLVSFVWDFLAVMKQMSCGVLLYRRMSQLIKFGGTCSLCHIKHENFIFAKIETLIKMRLCFAALLNTSLQIVIFLLLVLRLKGAGEVWDCKLLATRALVKAKMKQSETYFYFASAFSWKKEKKKIFDEQVGKLSLLFIRIKL